MAKTVKLTPPLTDKDVLGLEVGDKVLVSGVIYTARDAAHKRLIDLLEAGKPLPMEIKGQIIYYVGPSPARPGRVIGAAGPTTAYRMDSYAPTLIRLGLKAMIGKGKRSPEVIAAMHQYDNHPDTIRRKKLREETGAGIAMGRAISMPSTRRVDNPQLHHGHSLRSESSGAKGL